MERDSKKSYGSLVITLLLVAVCLVLGWYAGGKFADKEDDIISNNKSNTSKKTNVSKNQTIQVIHTQVGTFIIDKNGLVYYRNADKFVGAEIKMDNYTSIATYGNYEVSDYVTGLDYDENAKTTIENHNFNGYKLALENINSAYEIKIGNGESSEIIYFISKDGKVNELSVDSDGTNISINLKKDTSSYPNIVSVLQSSDFGAQRVILVDKDGNKYTEYKK